MKAYKIFKQSISALFGNKGRSFLTVLGIIIGIAAVIALMSLGSGAKSWITDRISTLGTSNITVMPGADTEGQGPMRPNPGSRLAGAQQASTLTEADLQALRDKAGQSGIERVSGNISNTAVLTTQTGEKRYDVLGTSADYFAIMSRSAGAGFFYTENDVASRTPVAVMGAEVARDVFGEADPVGQALHVNGTDYRVIGVLSRVDESNITDPNVQCFVPYTAAQDTFGVSNFTSLVIEAQDEDSVDMAKEEVTAVLLAQHGVDNLDLADFTIKSSQDLLSTVQSITDMLTAFLAGIAAISLLVGGIGIMNIMLVAVTERTREIGLRKAVGAKTRHILGQFLTEGLLLTIAGGVFGILVGFLLSRLVGRAMGITTIVTGGSVLLAVCVSAGIGLVFGIFPAAKAARLNPIEALRYE